ncbi:hypothetical protein HDV00_002519 [Rhizophlyctis rosea]|nr:hypothetical protein HDV00_002519 [Rhizophlyctis rosea]
MIRRPTSTTTKTTSTHAYTKHAPTTTSMKIYSKAVQTTVKISTTSFPKIYIKPTTTKPTYAKITVSKTRTMHRPVPTPKTAPKPKIVHKVINVKAPATKKNDAVKALPKKYGKIVKKYIVRG